METSYIIIIYGIYITPYSVRYLLQGALQYYYPRLRHVPIEHTSQLQMKYTTTHAAITGAKCYSNTLRLVGI